MIWVTVGKDLDFFLNAIVGKFFSEVVRRGDDVVGKVGVVYHQGPHFGFGDGVGEIIVAVDFDRMGNIPRMKPIQECGNNGTKSERNNIGDTHIFAAMHDLNGGDVQPLTQY